MSMRQHFIEMRNVFGRNVYNDFMIAHGVEYVIGPDTYAGRRGIPKSCFENAFHLAHEDKSLTYVEGKACCFGVPLDHAWCVNSEGVVVDPTIVNGHDRMSDYFGVPLQTKYVARAIVTNNVYGVLDYFHANLTVTKLFELGLVEGQAWLLNLERLPKKPKRKRA
jgi:hypothetical protein